MDTIQPGASFADIVAKMNEMITWMNTHDETQISYNDLLDKPRIDTIELTANSAMKDLRLDLAQFPNLAQLEDLVSSVAGNMAAQIAETVAAQKVQVELAVENAKSVGIQPQDSFKIMIYAQNEALEEVRYSLNFDEFAEYVNTYIIAQRSVVGG